MQQLKILVNGDSFCDERYFTPEELLTLNQKWSETIKAENIAHGGCSNERIFYSTIEYLNNNTVDVLIVGWTSWNRHKTTLVNGLELNICPNGAGDNLNSWFHDKSYMTHVEYYYKYFYNEYLNFKNFLNYYLHLQHHCLLKNIKFLNFFSVPENMPRGMELYNIAKTGYLKEIIEKDKKKYIQEKEKERLRRNEYIMGLRNLISKIDKKFWIEQQIGYSYGVFSQKFPRAKDGEHPSIEASAEWAKIIKKNLI
jgi:hypothetical protein